MKHLPRLRRSSAAFVAISTLVLALLAALGGEWTTFGSYYYPFPTDDGNLSALVVKPGILVPDFTPGVTSYNWNGVNISSCVITVAADDLTPFAAENGSGVIGAKAEDPGSTVTAFD